MANPRGPLCSPGMQKSPKAAPLFMTGHGNDRCAKESFDPIISQVRLTAQV